MFQNVDNIYQQFLNDLESDIMLSLMTKTMLAAFKRYYAFYTISRSEYAKTRSVLGFRPPLCCLFRLCEQ